MSPRSPYRFYYAGHIAWPPPSRQAVELSQSESHHLIHVLRLKPGTQIDLLDASGRCFSAAIESVHDGIALVHPMELLEEASDTVTPPINLAVSIVKRRAMDWMIEKLSELGVDTFQPLLSQRCVALGDIQPDQPPPPRWERIAIAAAKQCGRNMPMSIMPPTSINGWLGRARPPAHTVFAQPEPGALRLVEWVEDRARIALPMWVAIGPEGGWTPGEVEAFKLAGFQSVALGELTLRTETAALAAATFCRLAR